jgi:hypothetical protein
VTRSSAVLRMSDGAIVKIGVLKSKNGAFVHVRVGRHSGGDSNPRSSINKRVRYSLCIQRY